MAGRGSFIESFPLFGHDLNDYDELFAEKLELLLKLREFECVTWSGKHRPSLENVGVYPRPRAEAVPPEKLERLRKLREFECVTWSGKHRPSLENVGVYPRPLQKPLPVWIAV